MNFSFEYPANGDDVLFINRVRNASSEFLHDPRQFSFEETSKYLQKNPTRFLIVRLDGRMIGYARVNPSGSDCEIGADLAPEFRGMGLAKPLYLALLQNWAKPLGIRYLHLRVLRINKRAFKLYQTMNFTVEEETQVDYVMKAKLEESLATLVGQLGGEQA